MNSKEVKEIFNLIRQNRKLGVEKLYQTYYAQLYAIAFSIIKDHYKSQDIVHDVILRLLEMDDSLLPTDGELSWLATIIKNTTLNIINRDKKIEYRDGLGNLEEKNIEDTVDLEEFNKMIKDLDDMRKQVLSLRILGDYNFNEIGIILSIGARKARYYYNTALQKVKVAVVSLGITTMVFFVLVIVDILLTIFEKNVLFTSNSSGSLTNAILFPSLNLINELHYSMFFYYAIMGIISLTILAFFYHNAYELPTKAKRKKKNDKKN